MHVDGADGLGPLWRVLLYEEEAGWASTVIPMFVFSGLQMMSIGVLGEYLAKVYQEVKARPRFIIEEMVGQGLDGT